MVFQTLLWLIVLAFFFSYTEWKKSKKIFYNGLGAESVIAYFYDSLKRVGIFPDV